MQSLTRALRLALFVLVLAAGAQGQEIGSIVNATDLFKLKEVHSPAISPDGTRIVYAVKAIVEKPDGTYGYETNLWMTAPGGRGEPREVTHGAAGGSSPQWSPDGTKIAFVRAVDHVAQVFVLPVGEPGEAVQITRLETGASSPQWSPDGESLCFVSNLTWDDVRRIDKIDDPLFSTERPGRAPNDVAVGPKAPVPPVPPPRDQADGSLAQLRRFLTGDEETDNPRVTNRLEFEGEADLDPVLGVTQVYVVKAVPGATPVSLTPGYGSFTQPQWLADGKRIVCSGPSSETTNPDRDLYNDLYLISVSDRAIEHLKVAGYSCGQPQPSPDGKSIAFVAIGLNDLAYGQNVVGVEFLDGKTPGRILTAKLDRSVQTITWSLDSKFLYFTAPSNGGAPLYRVVNSATATVERLTGFDGTTGDFDVGANEVVMARAKATNPSELCSTDLDGKELHVLSTLNSSWLGNKLLSSPEHHVISRPDGLKVDAWLMKPTNYDGASKYPLILEIHGGPASWFGPSEPTTWFEFQYFAARGYGLVYANPRGSGGYGKAFQSANFKNWGPAPSADILAAADLAAEQPWVDPNREVVTGGSYGGYMTAWIVTHDHRFKAAVAQRGVYDLATFFGEGNAWRLLPDEFGGYPWEKETKEVLEANSPFTFVNQCTTPLLIKHGDNDLRTGFAQSEMFFRALKVLGRPVEYVRYPRATHELSRSGEPWQRLDRLVRFDEFFRRYVGDQ